MSDIGTARSELLFVPRYFAGSATKIAGDDIVWLHRDSDGGGVYLRNVTGQTNGFYIREILGAQW